MLFECDEYGHIAVDCPDRIPPSGTAAHHRRWHIRHCTRSTSRHHHQDRHKYTRLKSQSHSHGYQSQVMIIHAEVIPDHITDTTTEALPDTVTPVPIVTAMTHHTGNLHHIEAYQSTLEIIAGPDHMHHINPIRAPHLNPHPDPTGQQ